MENAYQIADYNHYCSGPTKEKFLVSNLVEYSDGHCPKITLKGDAKKNAWVHFGPWYTPKSGKGGPSRSKHSTEKPPEPPVPEDILYPFSHYSDVRCYTIQYRQHNSYTYRRDILPLTYSLHSKHYKTPTKCDIKDYRLQFENYYPGSKSLYSYLRPKTQEKNSDYRYQKEKSFQLVPASESEKLQIMFDDVDLMVDARREEQKNDVPARIFHLAQTRGFSTSVGAGEPELRSSSNEGELQVAVPRLLPAARSPRKAKTAQSTGNRIFTISKDLLFRSHNLRTLETLSQLPYSEKKKKDLYGKNFGKRASYPMAKMIARE